jgi:putative FmdB family regulatory protein
MALYEYVCESCSAVTERRMSMNDVLAHIECPSCGKTAKKSWGSFAVVGRAEAGMGDGPAPWDEGGMGGDHGHSHGHDHGHSHDFGDDFGDDFDEGIDL